LGTAGREKLLGSFGRGGTQQGAGSTTILSTEKKKTIPIKTKKGGEKNTKDREHPRQPVVGGVRRAARKKIQHGGRKGLQKNDGKSRPWETNASKEGANKRKNKGGEEKRTQGREGQNMIAEKSGERRERRCPAQLRADNLKRGGEEGRLPWHSIKVKKADFAPKSVSQKPLAIYKNKKKVGKAFRPKKKSLTKSPAGKKQIGGATEERKEGSMQQPGREGFRDLNLV